jgi:hypothetical protein
MSAVSTGVYTVAPQTGTTPQSSPMHESNQREASNAPTEAQQAAPPPPPPGMGKFVDKHV